MQEIADALEEDFTCSLPMLSGHGGSPIPSTGYSFDLFSEDLLRFMDERKIEKSSFFGYSMGGYAAVVFAQKHPDRVERLVTLGTKFDWNPTTASRETSMLNVDVMEQKIPAFISFLSKVHEPVHWKDVVNETAAFMRKLGHNPPLNAESMNKIELKTLLLVGDLDNTAGVEATRKAAMCLNNASFRVLASTPHPIEKVDKDVLSKLITDFLL
jgi:pimeloyl-ACP methyl ester carboxylesterase